MLCYKLNNLPVQGKCGLSLYPLLCEGCECTGHMQVTWPHLQEVVTTMHMLQHNCQECRTCWTRRLMASNLGAAVAVCLYICTYVHTDTRLHTLYVLYICRLWVATPHVMAWKWYLQLFILSAVTPHLLYSCLTLRTILRCTCCCEFAAPSQWGWVCNYLATFL